MKSFVFDLDGVICRGPNFTVALEKEFGIEQTRWRTFFTGPFAECLVGRRDLKMELAVVAPSVGWKASVEELLQFWFSSEERVCSEVLACVEELRLRDHQCYLGTNQERYRTDYIAQVMGLRKKFDRIFSSADIGYAKPAAEYFEAVRRAIEADEIILIDDSLRNVRAAELSGWQGLHYVDQRDIKRIFQAADLLTAPSAKAV